MADSRDDPPDELRRRLDGLRFPLGAVFLAAYAYSSLVPGPYGTLVFLGTGTVLYALSVPWSSTFHKGLALVGFVAFGVLLLSGRFEAGTFFEELPAYFNIVAVLLVLSIAGYPIRAARYEAQIRALMAAMTKRGVGVRTTAAGLGQVLGAVLDVGSLVLINVISHRAAPRERVEALIWAGRAFSFAPLWTNLNVFTATTVVLTGVSYPRLLATTLPYVILGLATTLLFAQREKGEVMETPGSNAPLDRGAIAVLLYPVLLVAAVALVSELFPGVPLTAAIAVTVAVIVVLIAVLASVLLRQTSPMRRLARETRDSLVGSHAEFALFGSAGVLVLSLKELGALAPVGSFLLGLPTVLVAPALSLVVGLGFLAGIHVIPLVLLINAAFPLGGGPAPALWAAAILLGSQGALLLTPFSNSVTMLSRLTGLHPLEIGQRNWKFSLFAELAGLVYLGLLTLLLL